MTTRRDAVLDQFEVLTQRTFLVLDTEFCTDDDGNHLISLGCVPVVRGKRASARQELHLVMNPGVPIDDATHRVHGFTDADVARKRRFQHYAPRILAYLDSFEADNPVLVTHTGTDVHLLRTELERLTDTEGDGDGDTGEAPTLPLMPLIDTSMLHRVIGLDGLSAGPAKLSALCSRLGVTNRGAHEALHDARATADVLVAMLLHAAGNFTGRHAYTDLDALLAAHNAGTTHEPRVGQVWRTRGWVEPLLPADHAARHARTDLLLLPGRDATSDDLADWVTTAEACVKLRCLHLPPAAALAATGHAASLWDPLWMFATNATAPGEAGTALAALMRLLDPSYGADPADEPPTPVPVPVPDTTAGALTHATAMPWWRRNRAAVDDSIACERSGSAACPDCRAGRGCSRDRFYEPVARIATFGRTGAIDKNNIKNRLFGRVGGERTPKRAYYDWTDPRCVAHMVWLVVTWTKARNQGVTAAKYLAQARADDYHLHDPRLARLVCEAVAETSGLDAAAAEVRRVLTDRSTDPAWDELTTWLSWRQHAAARAARASAARVITYPRLARPRGRANANPYLP